MSLVGPANTTPGPPLKATRAFSTSTSAHTRHPTGHLESCCGQP